MLLIKRFAAFLWLIVLTSCGGTSSPSQSASSIIVQATSAQSVIDQGATAQFTATVFGTSDQRVTWSVVEGSAGGTINAQGLYTAPATAGTFHVVAASQANTSKTSTVPIDVASVHVTVDPLQSVLQQGSTKQFTAAVTGTVNPGVTWLVSEGPSGGSIDSGGLYATPSAAGTYHVVATSQADPTKKAIATATVVLDSLQLSPSNVGLRQGQQRQFVASRLGAVANDVKWTVIEGVSGGEIDDQGVYTAPGTTGTFHVQATSNTDSAQSGTATVVVFEKGFRTTGSMNHARSMHTATLLKDGRVLIAGGVAGDGSHLDTAEIYDPATGSFSLTSGKMNVPRTGHSATLMNDGRVLIAGGLQGSTFVTFDASAELFDPSTETFSSVGDMTVGRAEHTATLLADGRVLIVGGGTGTAQGTAEFYDPVEGNFVPSGAATWDVDHAFGSTATRLLNDNVLIAGGVDSSDFVLGNVEVYDPATGEFTKTAALRRYYHTATLLKNGGVLMAGGSDGNFLLASAEVYQSAAGTFVATGNLTKKLWLATANLLDSGRVLVAGGRTSGICGNTNDECGPPTDLAELYDPVQGAFSMAASMTTSRFSHTATSLQDGRVLITGGITEAGTTNSAELYDSN